MKVIFNVWYKARNVQNARASCYPTIPNSWKEVHNILNSINVKTNKGENFIFENDSLNEIFIFSCDTNIEFLKKLKIVYMDGTFNYCEKISLNYIQFMD
jgi:hypothetical protein